MSRVTTLKPHEKRQNTDPALARLAGGVIGFCAGYLGSMILYNLDTHPIHWLAAVIFAALGILIGHFFAYFKNRRTS